MIVDVVFALQILVICVVVTVFCALIFVYVTAQPPNLELKLSEKQFWTSDNCYEPFTHLEDPPSLELSIVVPAYNEENRLAIMLEEALEYLEGRQKKKSFTYEIIIVDDGSKDGTTKLAQSYTAKHGSDKVRVMTLAQNKGKGGAVRSGMLCARGKKLLFADADGATKFSDIQKLEEKLETMDKNEDGMAVVCGSRAHLEKDAIATRSVFRTFLMFGFHFLVWALCVRGVRDTQCGFKIFTRSAARLLFYNLHVERWAFDVDMLHIAQNFNVPVSEVAVTWHEVEGTKLVPFWSWLQMGRDLLLIRLRYMIGAWKMSYKTKIS